MVPGPRARESRSPLDSRAPRGTASGGPFFFAVPRAGAALHVPVDGVTPAPVPGPPYPHGSSLIARRIPSSRAAMSAKERAFHRSFIQMHFWEENL